MSSNNSYDRSRPSTTDPYLVGFRPSTPGGMYITPSSSRTMNSYATDTRASIPSGMSSADYVRSIQRATGSTRKTVNLGYGGYSNEKTLPAENPVFIPRPRGQDSTSSGTSYSRSRRIAKTTHNPRSTTESRNMFDDYWANRDASAATTIVGFYPDQPVSSSSAVYSRLTSRRPVSSGRSTLGSSISPAGRTETPYLASRSSSSAHVTKPQHTSSDYSTGPFMTTESRGPSRTSTNTGYSKLGYDARAQVDTLNEAQRNSVPFEQYWAGLEQSVRSSHRRSSASRERSRERAASKSARDASRGGLGFQEWWSQKNEELYLLRGEEENMLNAREIERAQSRRRSSMGRKSQLD